jgi:phage shock protein E
MAIRLSPDQFREARSKEQGVLLDVRSALEIEVGYIEGATNYDLNNGDFEAAIPTLDKSQTYYLYCRSGARSGRASDMLLAVGFEKVYNVGGFEELQNAGFEVTY